MSDAIQAIANAKIGFIGAGNMAASILGGLIQSGLPAKQIYVSNPSQAKLDALLERYPHLNTSNDNGYVADNADYLLLSVKPQKMALACKPLQELELNCCVISVAAGVGCQTIEDLLGKGLPVAGARVLVLGLTYKENCPDLRNTKVVDIVHSLQSYGVCVDVYDPWIDPAEAMTEYGLPCLPALPQPGQYSAVVLAVAHQQFVAMGTEGLRALGHPGAVLFDVKSVLALDEADARL